VNRVCEQRSREKLDSIAPVGFSGAGHAVLLLAGPYLDLARN
jgi:hypothetical protein